MSLTWCLTSTPTRPSPAFSSTETLMTMFTGHFSSHPFLARLQTCVFFQYSCLTLFIDPHIFPSLKKNCFYWSLISSFIFDPWILIFDPGSFISILWLNIDPWPRYERHIVFPKVLAQNCDDFNCNNTIYNADQKKSGSVRRHMTSYLSHEVKISLTPKISLTR